MTTKQKWALVLSLLAIAAIIYFWDDIVAQWNKWFPAKEELPKDGDPCKDANGNNSVIENGACKQVSIPGPNGGGSGGGGGGNGGNGGNAAV